MRLTLVKSAVLAAALTTLALPASAHKYTPNSGDEHPLRLIGYALHPVGVVIEFAVTRPIHWVASQDCFDIILGHDAHYPDRSTTFQWRCHDGGTSVMDEVKARRQAQATKAK